jgi:adenylate kinase family enzyme
MGPARIYITGASGAGVTTLGNALAQVLDARAVDVDDFYWMPTDPPYTTKRPREQRVRLLKIELDCDRWILCGSFDGWGDELIGDVDLVLFVDTPTAIRLQRLRDRERRRYGARISVGGDMNDHHVAFIAWAASYDDGGFQGRNRPRHQRWLQQLGVPVLRLNGERPTDELVAQVLRFTGDDS